MDKLKLGRVIRKGQTFLGGLGEWDRQYIDFIVSGKSLGELLDLQHSEKVGALGWAKNIEREIQIIDEFLGLEQNKYKKGRTCFYVCKECGSIGCGALTATILVLDKIVIWKDFGFENDRSEPNLEPYKNIGPFSFDRVQYFKKFEELKDLTKNSKQLPLTLMIVASR